MSYISDNKIGKTALVVLYNHNFERNIPVIRKLYSDKFSNMLQLMPYYSGHAHDVARVYGHSFRFYDYILQAREKIKQLDCEHVLIIGDDLLLNPEFNEFNTASKLGLTTNDSFYGRAHSFL